MTSFAVGDRVRINTPSWRLPTRPANGEVGTVIQLAVTFAGEDAVLVAPDIGKAMWLNEETDAAPFLCSEVTPV